MAIELSIPKDVRKYEAKLVGPLTTRQTVCLIPACILSATAYITVSKLIGSDIAIFVSMLLVTPLILFGWFKPYGIPLEKFLKTIFKTTILAPKNRIYKTQNTFANLTTNNHSAPISTKKTAKKTMKQKHVPTEYIQYK